MFIFSIVASGKYGSQEIWRSQNMAAGKYGSPKI